MATTKRKQKIQHNRIEKKSKFDPRGLKDTTQDGWKVRHKNTGNYATKKRVEKYDTRELENKIDTAKGLKNAAPS